MTKPTTTSLTWRQFLISPDQGGGTMSCAVTGRSDGRVCGLLRVGNRGDTTIVMKSDKLGAPLDVQAIHCSSSGCETAESLRPIAGRSNRYRLPASARHRQLVIDVNRPSANRLDVAVNGMSSEPHVLHYYADRGTVTLGSEISSSSLMRGGSKLRVGRSHGYGVFAVEDIKAGEIVEEAPVLSQSTPFLTDYTFSSGGKHILPLGNLALYNHSDDPSCSHSLDASGSVMTLTAARDIKAGTQCSISYGGPVPGGTTSAWFMTRGIVPHPID